MASLVADYRPVHLTEEPLHTPRLPLRGGAGVLIRTHHARSSYLVITPLPLQELATFVLTVTRSEASVQGLREGDITPKILQRRSSPHPYGVW